MEGPVPAEAMSADLRAWISEATASAPLRLISIIPADNGDGTLRLVYMFQHGERVVQRAYTIRAEEEIDSIAGVFKGALNMEREDIDLFGLRFKGVEGGLLLSLGGPIAAPLRKPLSGAKPEEG